MRHRICSFRNQLQQREELRATAGGLHFREIAPKLPKSRRRQRQNMVLMKGWIPSFVFDTFTTFISHIGQKTGLNRAVSSCIWQYSMSVLHGKQGYPTPAKRILHPILHPNMPLFTGSFTTRCRKCRIFFKNFF